MLQTSLMDPASFKTIFFESFTDDLAEDQVEAASGLPVRTEKDAEVKVGREGEEDCVEHGENVQDCVENGENVQDCVEHGENIQDCVEEGENVQVCVEHRENVQDGVEPGENVRDCVERGEIVPVEEVPSCLPQVSSTSSVDTDQREDGGGSPILRYRYRFLHFQLFIN